MLGATYNLACLVIVLGDGTNKPMLEVVFSSPYAFRVFAESDYYHYLGAFRGKTLIDSTDGGCGIKPSTDAPYLLDYQAHARFQGPEEETFSCLIMTPDHCVEAICFEEPAILRL